MCLHTFTAQVEGSILGIGKIFICINILGPGIPGIPVVKYIIILTGILLYSETTYKKNYYRIPEIPVGFRNRWGSVTYSVVCTTTQRDRVRNI